MAHKGPGSEHRAEEIKHMSEAAFASGGRSAFAGAPVGTAVDGTIVSVEDRQVTDMNTGAPKFWDKEETRPQMQAVITIEVTPEDAQDDGLRSVYAKGVNLRTFGRAARDAGATSYAALVGRRFWGRYSGDGEAKRGQNAPKLHEYKIGPAASSSGGAALAAAESTAPPF